MLVQWPEVEIKTNMYVVANGIGKCSLFTNLINDLSAKDGKPISISSPWPELFEKHPKVMNSIRTGEFVDKYSSYIDDIIYLEPYQSNYIKGKEHIIHQWRKLFNLPNVDNTFTDLYTDDKSKLYLDEIKKVLNTDKFIVVQLKGGTNIHVRENRNDVMSINRNLVNDYDVVTAILENFKEHYVVIVKTKFDIYDKRVENLDRVSVLEDENLHALVELVNQCDFFVSIDSCVQHLAANVHNPKKGIVIWGNITDPITIGHNHNINIRSLKLTEVVVGEEQINKALLYLKNG